MSWAALIVGVLVLAAVIYVTRAPPRRFDDRPLSDDERKAAWDLRRARYEAEQRVGEARRSEAKRLQQQRVAQILDQRAARSVRAREGSWS